MRLIAYYHHLDANVMRRAIGPISVLSTRGQQTFYSHLTDPVQMASGNFQLVILPNWSWDGKLPEINGHYCYDLSDAALLQDEKALNVLRQCQSAMVPHATLAKLVKPFCPDVWVQPSLVHAE